MSIPRYYAIQNVQTGQLLSTRAKFGSNAPSLFANRHSADNAFETIINSDKVIAALEQRSPMKRSGIKIIRVRLSIIEDVWSKK